MEYSAAVDLNRLVEAGLVEFDPNSLRIHHTIQSLPSLTKDAVSPDDSCPICLTPFKSIFEEQGSSSVTQLRPCGHMFCRKDLVEWIRNRNGTCPTCRHVFLRLNPWIELDNEYDGNYFLEEDEEGDDDADYDDRDSDFYVGYLNEVDDDPEFSWEDSWEDHEEPSFIGAFEDGSESSSDTEEHELAGRLPQRRSYFLVPLFILFLLVSAGTGY
ncbi:hypothetical protein AX16_010283 [Volvariella volvacea WC 439]|nr:hypothetical protein AX16_010283 [Volvariella volvacea WC 439]